MRERRRKLEDLGSSLEARLERERMGLPRYRKTRPRDELKLAILMKLWMKKIAEAERDDFIPIGFRRRRIKLD